MSKEKATVHPSWPKIIKHYAIAEKGISMQNSQAVKKMCGHKSQGENGKSKVMSKKWL